MTLRTKHMMAVATLILAVAGIAIADTEKRLSASESLAAALSKPQPDYPAMAKQLRLEGSVNLNAFVTEEGTVDHVEPVSGNPILVRSAEDALKRWKFSKQTEDGKPVKFVATVIFNFKQ
jgi:periplasmic protein TonB